MAGGGPSGAEFLFLLDHGVPRGVIERALEEANALRVPAERVLIAGGHVEEDAFYRALAQACGVPFAARPLPAASADGLLGLAAGTVVAAPGARYRFIAAPRGEGLVALLRSAGPSRHLSGLALTSPTRLQQAVLGVDGASIAARAVAALPDACPGALFRDELRPVETRLLLGIVFLAAVLLVLFPASTLRLGQVGLGLVFLAFLAIRLASLVSSPGRVTPPHPIPDVALPDYAVLIPLHREADDVLEPLVEAIGRLDYPPAKLDVLFLVEAEDAQTIAGLRRLRLPGYARIVVCPPGRPRTKPRALNIGLQLARGDLVVVYDAEDRPAPDQLRLAAAAFADLPRDVGCLQAALTIRNGRQTWLTRQFELEYVHLFEIALPGLARLSLPIALGGTSNHFRRDVLERCLAWDAWNVTEDADLGFRLFAAGQRVAALPSATTEEAPPTLRHWFGQRRRWFKGWLQTAIVHARSPRRRGARGRRVDRWFVLVQVFGTVASALAFPVFLWSWVQLALGLGGGGAEDGLAIASAAVSAIVFVSGVGHLILAWYYLHRRHGVFIGARDAAFVLPYLLLVSAAALSAVWDLVDDPFHWHKTAHGRAAAGSAGGGRASARDA